MDIETTTSSVHNQPSTPVYKTSLIVQTITERKWKPLFWRGDLLCTDEFCPENHRISEEMPVAARKVADNVIEVVKIGEPLQAGKSSAVYHADLTDIQDNQFLSPEVTSSTSWVLLKDLKQRPPIKIHHLLHNQSSAFTIYNNGNHVAPPPQRLGPGYYIQENLGSNLFKIFDDKAIPDTEGHTHPLTFSMHLEILRQATAAVQQCHRAHIIHQDIKMENFLARIVDGKLEVHLIDFEDSTNIRLEPNRSHISFHQYVDTPSQNILPPTEAADLYGLGCLIAEMLKLPIDCHFCRVYLSREPEYLESLFAQALEKWRQSSQPSSAKEHAVYRLADLVKRIFLADRELTLYALENHLPYVLYFKKKPGVEFFIDSELYNTLTPLSVNHYFRYIGKDSLMDETGANNALQKVNLQAISGVNTPLCNRSEDFALKMHELYPSTEYIIETLDDISREYLQS